jgi:HK97 family phage major capsid protein
LSALARQVFINPLFRRIMSEFLKIQSEARAKAWNEAQALLDRAATENRDLTAEENEQFARINADIDQRAALIEQVKAAEEREARAAEAARGFEVRETASARTDADILRSIANGEVRSHSFEKRALVPSDNTVPKSFYDEVFAVARLVGPMLDVSQVISTASGENLTIPTLTAYSTATIKAASSAIAESEPTFSSITLGAFKYSFLVPVANELVSDAGFNLQSVLADEIGNAIGYAVNAGLTTGTGTVQPTGVVTAAGSGVTGGTGVAGAFTADNLIDLQYTLDGAARRLPGVAYMATGSAIGAMRKLKDTAGNYLYQVNVGQPDSFAGYNVIENPAMAAVATSAKSVLFGHLPSYKARVAGGLNIAQSTDYGFDTDTTWYRATLRVDGNLTHAGHIKYFAGAAS